MKPVAPVILLSTLFSALSLSISNGQTSAYTPKVLPPINVPLPSQILSSGTAKFGGEYKSEGLYTAPDPAAQGGISLTSPCPVESAFAVPQSNQYHVYKGAIGPDKKEIKFTGLPVAKYDLALICADKIYEGFCLNRDDNDLTPGDIKFIELTIGQSIPFFDLKRVERLKGTTGKAGKSTAVLQEMRIGAFLNQNGDIMKGHQLRSLKLAFCEDVGKAGWQLFQTREIIRTDVFPEMPHGLLPVKFVESLENIRVTDSVKRLDGITLP